jgi:hypothetical protein
MLALTWVEFADKHADGLGGLVALAIVAAVFTMLLYAVAKLENGK